MKRTYKLLSLFVLGIAGCATSQVSGPITESADSDGAIVVLSVTHSEDAGTSAKGLFYMDSKVGLTAQRLLYSRQDVLGIPKSSDFDEFEGVVYVLKLEPGIHAIDSWNAQAPPAYVGPKTKPQPLPFEIKAGDVVYLGNLHMNISLTTTWLGAKTINDAAPEVRDQFSRDIEVAERKVPGISKRITARLLPIGLWRNAAEDTVRSVEVPIIAPTPVVR